ncbi:hypothetical protein FU659_32485 [Paenibacillus sp. N3.4]|nr:hypothetical protein FU659_32485 [Paenibacillus sp. N3.4]
MSTVGLVTALKDGQVKVVASATDGSGVTGSVTIDVSGQIVQVTSIAVTGANGANAITSKGGQLQMTADVLPAIANNKTVSWSVYNTDGTQTDKATISTAGLVTALKDGQVKVVASAADGSGVTGSATINISGQVVQPLSLVHPLQRSAVLLCLLSLYRFAFHLCYRQTR